MVCFFVSSKSNASNRVWRSAAVICDSIARRRSFISSPRADISQWARRLPHQSETCLWIWFCGTRYCTSLTGLLTTRFRFDLKELNLDTTEYSVFYMDVSVFILSNFIDSIVERYTILIMKNKISQELFWTSDFSFVFYLEAFTNWRCKSCEGLMEFRHVVNRAAPLTGFTCPSSYCCSCSLPVWTRLGGRCFYVFI